MTVQNIYACSNCGAQFPKWSGRCLECGAWGSLEKGTVDKKKDMKNEAPPAKVIDLAKISGKGLVRLDTGIMEVDRVLGGGVVEGSLVLMSGEPGIGKSTLIAQISDSIAKNSGTEVIYVSGEESASQVKNRFTRLDCDLSKIKFIGETNLESIASALVNIKPKLAVIDSVQTVHSSQLSGEAGSAAQIRAVTAGLLEVAKSNSIAIVLIGHITKDGQIAGPKLLEHIVDTVLYLETEQAHEFRVLRSSKNRFGSVNELGLFEMTGKGFVEVKNPTAVFVQSEDEKSTGSVISCIMEGTRPFLIELQALVTKTVFGYPQRKASGFDLNRLQVLSAVLSKRGGVNLANQDIILNVVGGLKIAEPALDLAACLGIISSLLNQPISRKTLVCGEVGLSGEVRNVRNLEFRLKEAEKLGFSKVIIPAAYKGKAGGLEVVRVKGIGDLVGYLRK